MTIDSTASDSGGRRTALHGDHVSLGASFTNFGGWQMPLKYTSELAEHHAVRQSAGLFDLSHMGEVWVTGAQAAEFLDYALVGKLSAVDVGRAKYSLICAPDGGIIDDLITYRITATGFLVVPNAGNASVVSQALVERSRDFDVDVTDVSATTSLIAVQGPNSAELLLGVVPEHQAAEVRSLKYYASASITVAGNDVLVGRTGYTGEDGFEIFVDNALASEIWHALLDAGAGHGLAPAGLACRDSLRLEAGMPLYGNELSRAIDPYSAGLGSVVALASKAGDFVGRDALRVAQAAHDADPPAGRVLVGLRGSGRRSARPHNKVVSAGLVVGEVTSGIPSPTLGYPVALAYVDSSHAALGTELEIDVRGSLQPYLVVPAAFYRRTR